MTKPAIRCAIYTRKSSEEGLDQDYNSLHAQAEACAAYIASQKHEGWKCLPSRYDDGGVSGGTLQRPALQRLLSDIEAGRVDMVVVYKIDRLTRSLADFAKLVDRFDAASCSFVSVTQAFNTSSSMGRLTLNVLLSFAQFEREVTAERIRDKIAASKKKGLWMGGLPPLGYDPHPDTNRRELVINKAEAETVLRLFTLYLEHGCLNATARAAAAEGLRSKHRCFTSGRTQGGGLLGRGHIHRILTNPIYRGQIRHHDRIWPGTHSAIIDEMLWERVQVQLQSASARQRGSQHPAGSLKDATPDAPLLGKLRDETGDLLTPTHTQARGRRFRYYVSNRLISAGPDPTGWRLPAPALEAAIVEVIAGHLETQATRHDVLQSGSATEQASAAAQVQSMAQSIRAKGCAVIAHAIASIEIRQDHLHIRLDRTAIARLSGLNDALLTSSFLAFPAPLSLRRRGVETKIVVGSRAPTPDRTLLRALRLAHRWADMLKSGSSLKDIAQTEARSESYVARLLPLATLSPSLQQAIISGTQPVELSLEVLVRSSLPLAWSDQERRFGLKV